LCPLFVDTIHETIKGTQMGMYSRRFAPIDVFLHEIQ
jgi:hypothetical protein